MNVIYEPKGRAREYSPYALNIYNRCDHDCEYCYVKTMRFYRAKDEVKPRKDIVKNLISQLSKQTIDKQVLLCFTGDAYCLANDEYGITREVLKVLNDYNVPTAILTKGGKRALQDIDIFKKFSNIKVGATLTFVDKSESLKAEPLAAVPQDRLDMLKELHKSGIRTWVSFEPVIDYSATMKLLDLTKDFVDEYKVGKMNHYDTNIDWSKFGNEIAGRLYILQKDFYIKKELYKLMTLRLPRKYREKEQ